MESITFRPGQFQDPAELDPYISAIQQTLEGPSGKVWIRFIEALIENQKEALVDSNLSQEETRGGIKLLRWIHATALFPLQERIAEREAREAQTPLWPQSITDAIRQLDQTGQ